MMNRHKTKRWVLEEAQKFAFVQPGKNISITTLRHYHADGTRATMLAGAGAIPCLIMYPMNWFSTFRILLFNHYVGMCRPKRGDAEIDWGVHWTYSEGFSPSWCRFVCLYPLVPLPTISTDSPAGRMIRSEIIPCIAFLQRKYPLQLRLVFSTSFLSQFCPPSQVQTLDCTDISYTDNLFDRFIYKWVYSL